MRLLQSALTAAQSGKPEREILSQISAASPEFAAITATALAKGGRSLFVALLACLLVTCSNTQAKLDWNQLVDQARVYLTGGDPFPGLGNTEASLQPPSQKAEMSRQQRRQQERRSKKRRQSSAPTRK